ncbi:hypothetical protein L6251_00290 [Candidatus Parcubacteria bacterium]|nr:hypothetical protein [Candidatus Parcubacteria bacterium]
MEQELTQKIESLEKQIQENTKLVRQMRKYFLWALIISVAIIILPLIGLLFAIPQFLDTYSSLGL